MRLTIATRIEEARQGRGEDRINVVEADGRKVIIVADGAGGTAGGAAAAEALCHALTDAANPDTIDWPAWLAKQDTALAASGTGLAAAVVLSIGDDGEIRGASVGDCEAWAFAEGVATSLTTRQLRKPLLGDGRVQPVGFSFRLTSGTLIVVLRCTT